jgi:hypothetical protein
VPITSVGFFGSFSNYDANNNLVSGAQSTVVIAYKGVLSDPNLTQDVVNKISDTSMASYSTDPTAANSVILTNPDILICLDSGTSQYGSITIGGANGQRLSTTVQISSGTPPDGCPTV